MIKTRFFSNQTNLGAPVFWKKDFGGPVRTPPSTAAPDQPLARPSGWFPPIIEVSLRDGNPIEENDQILIANGLLRHGWGSRVFSRPIYPPPKKKEHADFNRKCAVSVGLDLDSIFFVMRGLFWNAMINKAVVPCERTSG